MINRLALYEGNLKFISRLDTKIAFLTSPRELL
jgi:hypothetical protein